MSNLKLSLKTATEKNYCSTKVQARRKKSIHDPVLTKINYQKCSYVVFNQGSANCTLGFSAAIEDKISAARDVNFTKNILFESSNSLNFCIKNLNSTFQIKKYSLLML